MTSPRAIVWIDHQTASLLNFDDHQPAIRKFKLHTHPTGQHGSSVRSEHEFFGEVCDALAGFQQVLVVGPHLGIADFERYAKKHRPHAAHCMVGFQVVDHPTDKQLAALGREFVAQRESLHSSEALN